MSINFWGSDDPDQVAKGGTGRATLTANGVLVGATTSPVNITSPGTNGQLLIGTTSSDPSFATPTGDSNEISVALGSNSLTIGIADSPVLPGSESTLVPSGTTAQRPGSPAAGTIRYNSDTSLLEGWNGSAWVNFTSGGTADGAFIYLATNTVSSGASLTFSSSDLSSSYTRYVMYIDSLLPDSGGTDQILIQVSVGGTPQTSSYETNVTAYRESGILTPQTIVTNGWELRAYDDTISGSVASMAEVWFSGMETASGNPMAYARGNTVDTTSRANFSEAGGGIRTGINADGIVVSLTSGNDFTASARLYGIKE